MINICIKRYHHSEPSSKVIRFTGYFRGFRVCVRLMSGASHKGQKEMNGMMLARKPLHIGLIQLKKDRQDSLSSHRMQSVQNPGPNHCQSAPPSANVVDTLTHLHAN